VLRYGSTEARFFMRFKILDLTTEEDQEEKEAINNAVTKAC
jgi:hypothetical protein